MLRISSPPCSNLTIYTIYQFAAETNSVLKSLKINSGKKRMIWHNQQAKWRWYQDTFTGHHLLYSIVFFRKYLEGTFQMSIRQVSGELFFEYLFLSFSLKFVARFVCFSNCASLHPSTDWLLGVAGFRRRAKTDSGKRGLIFFWVVSQEAFCNPPQSSSL